MAGRFGDPPGPHAGLQDTAGGHLDQRDGRDGEEWTALENAVEGWTGGGDGGEGKGGVRTWGVCRLGSLDGEVGGRYVSKGLHINITAFLNPGSLSLKTLCEACPPHPPHPPVELPVPGAGQGARGRQKSPEGAGWACPCGLMGD